MPKVYTKTGDRGMTSLYTPTRLRLPKFDTIFQFLGELDELSAHVGMLCVHIIGIIKKREQDEKNTNMIHHTNQFISVDELYFYRKIQNKLLDIGSSTSMYGDRSDVKEISKNDIEDIENKIDHYESKNTKLTEFILFGIDMADAQANLCRVIARKVERTMWLLREENDQIKLEDNAYIYMNRLSDLFFVFTRFLSECKELRRSEVSNN